MGNCLSCFKAPAATPQTSDSMSSTKDKDDVQRPEEVQRLTPLSTVDTQLNGNSKPVAEKPSRTLCSLLPGSLGREKDVSEVKINNLFEAYKEPNRDVILADGIEKLCSDLDLSPDEFKVLILAWRLNAEQMCQFTRVEFVSGCKEMHVDSIKGIQQRLPDIAAEVNKDPELFKDLYRFTFRFGLDVSRGQRILPSDMAICLWKLVFTGKEPLILVRWLNFLESHPHVRGIPRDTWNMFLNFAETVGDDLSSYDDTEAWPSLFDDFVEYENDAANQNVSKDRIDNIIIKERS
ncbi:DCN1-like protein 3 [Frankliniella occidentalis]|uniref:Defective in cullin neddylation protein n=1 Tax=Frankliniella occidentalis TaxID=133901 RepID=A0A6J1SF56_FRAOC|nr:DCN1-like protein 3 [Frankliniella occidentalis]